MLKRSRNIKLLNYQREIFDNDRKTFLHLLQNPGHIKEMTDSHP